MRFFLHLLLILVLALNLNPGPAPGRGSGRGGPVAEAGSGSPVAGLRPIRGQAPPQPVVAVPFAPQPDSGRHAGTQGAARRWRPAMLVARAR